VDRAPNGQFTGQQDILAEIEACILGDTTHEDIPKQYVLGGIGGVGKSEIALQFAHHHRQDYWGIFWIDCSTLESAQRSFALVAKSCCWDRDTGDELTKAVVRELSNSALSWLLVLDNCDDPDLDYAPFIPTSQHGALLMTTRLFEVRTQYGLAGSHLVEGLQESHATELLLKTAGISMPVSDAENTAAKSIVEQLHLHTLAITVAASLVKSGLYSLEEYSSTLKERHAELFRSKPRQAQSIYGTIEATFEISVTRLLDFGHGGKNALELLKILAYLDRTDVPEELFARAWKWGDENRRNPVHVEREATKFDLYKLSTRHFNLALSFDWATTPDLSIFKQARSRLAELSLVSMAPGPNGGIATSMHPLLHSWARSRLEGSQRLQAWQFAAATLALSAENDLAWRTFTPQLQRHLETCYDLRPLHPEDSTLQGFLRRTLNLFWWQLHRASSGRVVSIVADLQNLVPKSRIESSEGTLDGNCIRVLRMQALTHRDVGNCVETLAIQQRILRTYEGTFGQRDRNVRWGKFAVGRTLYLLKRYKDAAQIFEGGLADLRATESELPREDIRRFMTLEALGATYLSLGKPEQAVSLLEEAVELGWRLPKEDLELEHSTARHGLARAYIGVGQQRKAIPLLEEALKSKRKLFAPGHRSREITEALLVRSYTDVGQLKEARRLLMSMLPHLRRHTEHECTVYRSLEKDLAELEHGIAMEYYDNDRLDLAIPLLEEVVQHRVKLLPPADRRRCASEYNLLRSYIKAKNILQARHQLDLMLANVDTLVQEDRQDVEELERTLLRFERSLH
jgi:tetratricopeptide (TPR) repeat protein